MRQKPRWGIAYSKSAKDFPPSERGTKKQQGPVARAGSSPFWHKSDLAFSLGRLPGFYTKKGLSRRAHWCLEVSMAFLRKALHAFQTAHHQNGQSQSATGCQTARTMRHRASTLRRRNSSGDSAATGGWATVATRGSAGVFAHASKSPKMEVCGRGSHFTTTGRFHAAQPQSACTSGSRGSGLRDSSCQSVCCLPCFHVDRVIFSASSGRSAHANPDSARSARRCAFVGQ